MSILKIAHMGHPVLRQRARPLDKAAVANPAVQKLIDDMIDTMHEYRGVGLAAPQVHEGLRLFVGLLDDEEGEGASDAAVLINPEFEPLGDAREEGWEGCLSIPDIRGKVPRYAEILLRGLDREGREVSRPLKDFPARVAQHETDHLNGVLFFDRMTSFETLTYLEEYSRFWARDDE